MTRKDYEALALALGKARVYAGKTQRDEANGPFAAPFGVQLAEEQITYALKVDNARFDEDRFAEAITEAEKNVMKAERVAERLRAGAR